MYRVQVKRNDKWFDVVGSGGQRGYSYGWFDALSSLIPRPSYRILKEDKVIEESKACSGVQVNA